VKKFEQDPFYKLEHAQKDEQKAKDIIPSLAILQDLKDTTSKDDFGISSMLRKKFREEKKQIEAVKKESETKGFKNYLLLPPSDSDATEAKGVKFANSRAVMLHDKHVKQRLDIKSQSIFATTTAEQQKKKKLLLDIASKRKKLGVNLFAIDKEKRSTPNSFSSKPTVISSIK